jgi:hypothetical protein
MEKIILKDHVLIDFDNQYTNYDLSKIPQILDIFNNNEYTNFGNLYNDNYKTLDINDDEYIQPVNIASFTITNLKFENNKIIGTLQFLKITPYDFYVAFHLLVDRFNFEFDICGDFKNNCINDIKNFVIKFI